MSSNRPTRHPPLDNADEVKQSLEIGLGRTGQDLDRWVTLRELRDAGIGSVVRVDGRGSLRGPGGRDFFGDIPDTSPPDYGQDDMTRPPAPRNVRAYGLSLDAIGVKWDPPHYNNHAYTEIFASFADNWAEISRTFNPDRPVGPGNRPQHFMGTSAGTTFIHHNLVSTVPVLDLARDLMDVVWLSGHYQAIIDGDHRTYVAQGDTVYFNSDEAWALNGIEGEVMSVTWNGQVTAISVDVSGVTGSHPTPGSAAMVQVREIDDLQAALEPDPIYYWARFISTAQVAGPVQSEAGVSATVMLDPEAILNIMTGRIRSSQLAQDIIRPINFIRGPITEVDEQGNRKYPTVRDFVLAQGEGLLTEYDEIWHQAIVGTIPEGYPGAATAAAAIIRTEAKADDHGAYIQVLEQLEAAFENGSAFGPEAIVAGLNQRQLVRATDAGALSYLAGTLSVSINDTDYSLNEVAQIIETQDGQINNTITLRVQQNTGGVWTAAGFGIGLEGEPDDLTSTFAVAVDQFAIMSAANDGREVVNIQGVTAGGEPRHLISINPQSPLPNQHFAQGDRVTLTIPFGSEGWKTSLRGKVFEVADIIGHSVWLRQAEGEDFVQIFGQHNLDGLGVALFREQSVPFIVNTTTTPSVVGIRGKLVVDGMIHARDVEVTNLLRSKEIWAQGITAFGLIQTPSLVGEVIATPRIGGWAMKMTSSDTTYNNRVLEYSRWDVAGYGQGEADTTYTDLLPDEDTDDIITQRDHYPQLRADKPDDTCFWLDAQGHAFIRGSLQVGGNARILTYASSNSPGDTFVQMDHEFPLMVMPLSETWGEHPGAGVDVSAIPGYGEVDSSGRSLRQVVRNEALFWVHKGGEAGFNTHTDSIFMGDTPMEPPSTGGAVRVIARQRDGAPTGRGRVWACADFSQVTNRFRPDSMVGFYIGLFLADANTNYGGHPETHVPTDRNGVQTPGGGLMHPPISGETANFLNTHFLIIRASSNSGDDPGWVAYNNWLNRFDSLHHMGGYYVHSYPTQRFIQGTCMAVAGRYKVLVVVVERFHRTGGAVWGPINTGTDSGACIGITQGNVFSQQITTRAFEGSLRANAGVGGGTPPQTPPPPPGPPPGGENPIILPPGIVP